MNFILTNFLRQLERLAEMNILLSIWILHVQFYWRLELNVYENLKRTNFLWQLERLEINVLYQYESYAYKFIRDWNWMFTSMWILYVLIFWQFERLEINVWYQYESYTHKFIGDLGWKFTSICEFYAYRIATNKRPRRLLNIFRF